MQGDQTDSGSGLQPPAIGNSSTVNAEMPWWMRHQVETGHFTVNDNGGQRCLECADKPWVDDFLDSVSAATRVDQFAAWLLSRNQPDT